MIWAAAIALLFQGAPAVRQPVAKASIAGVVRSVTGEAIPNVQVTLARIDAPLGQFGDFVSADRPPVELVLTGYLLEAIKEIPPDPGASPAETAAFASLQLEDIDQLIVNPTGAVAVVSKSVPPILTDGQGRFAFNGIEPGTYRLIFSASGFAKQDYGQRVLGGPGTAIALAAGETKGDIVMGLTRVSALGGRILDNRVRPLAGVPVQLFRFSYDQTARRQIQIVASAQSDDRGDYRFYFLSPGRYYVKAGHETNRTLDSVSNITPFDETYLSQNRIPQNYALTYYRDVTDVNAAAAIDLQGGAELSGIDLFLGPQRTYRLRGRVIDSRTGQPPQRAQILLRPQSSDFLNSIGAVSGASNYKAADGTFEIPAVAPGRYTLDVEVMNVTNRPMDMAALSPAERNAYYEAMRVEQLARPKGSLPIEVTNADIEGLDVAVGATSLISGRIRLENPASSATAPFNDLVVQLKPTGDAGPPGSSNQHAGAVKSDGTFSIEGVPIGEYNLSVVGLPPGFYLKGAGMAQADVLNAAMRVSGRESNTLDIVMSPNAGEISGNVIDSRGQPAPGVQVVMIPNENRYRTELFRPVTSDASGHFSIPSITPGNYKLVAWEVIESYGFFDPELIKQAEQNGKPIRIDESSNQTVTVRAW
jgi:protocatechuate 3,4-dioxygenase beta subunit